MFMNKSLLLALSLMCSTVIAYENTSPVGDRGVWAAFRRDDGASGDGNCDPCLDTCTTNHRRADTSKYLEMIGAHDTRPHKIGEPVRWRNVSTVDSSGKTILAFNLEFDCSQIAEVCNNMCYGVYCKGFSWTNTVQRDNTAQCQAARKANACGKTNPNYCSTRFSPAFSSGYSCDEYPFASTKQGQTTTNTATRCVPAGQNSSQGGKISGLYRNGQNGSGRLSDGQSFTVTLTNPGSSPNCASYSGGAVNCNKASTVSGQSQK